MALITPTTQDIADNILAQIEAAINQTVPLLPKAFIRWLSKVLAAVFILLYKYSGFIFLQLFVSTASDQPTEVNGKIITPLEEWGTLSGAGLPGAAVAAEMTIDITVTNQVGTLAAGAQLLNTTNGVTYITIAAVLLDASTVTTTIRAVNDQADTGGAGAIGNLDPGDIVSFANALANVNRDTVVNTLTVTGTNAEVSADYRIRIIERFQSQPQGGAYADYRIWGSEVDGVARIYPYTSATPGIVDVYVEADSTIDPDGIAPQSLLDDVLDAINLDVDGLASRRPATAFPNVISITRTGFDVTVSGLTVDDPASVQASIDAAVVQFLAEREPFIQGLSILPKKEEITQNALINLVYDIVNAAGGTFTTVQFELTSGGGFITTYTLGEGELSKLSTSVTFV
jgi:uncharacterized phage protein gp47/JayE